VRESAERGFIPYSSRFMEFPIMTRDHRISKLTTSPRLFSTSSDEGNGSSQYSSGPFSPTSSPLSPIHFSATPEMPLPPIPMPSNRFSLVPTELPFHPSHHGHLSRVHSIHNFIRRSEEPVQEIDAGVTLLHGFLQVNPPGLPPAYFSQPVKSPTTPHAHLHRSLNFKDAKMYR
jgi:hypothetical protein